MQDRILGPLTMLQFIYAVVGGGVCYGIFMSIPRPFSYVLIFPIAIFVLALVFLKINERPFLDFLKSVLEYMSAPKDRVWRHQANDNLEVQIYQTHKKKQADVQAKRFSHQEISDFAQKIDQK